MNQNVDTIHRAYQAFNSGDMKTLTELFHENASWHYPGRSPMSGDHKGRDAVFAFFARAGQATEGTFQANLLHLLADEDGRVVSIQRPTAQRGGKSLSADSCIVFEVKNGRVVSATEYIYDLDAAEAFWS